LKMALSSCPTEDMVADGLTTIVLEIQFKILFVVFPSPGDDSVLRN
jgi:hypothetical protein